MALPRTINDQSKQSRTYGSIKIGHTFTLVETQDVSLVWQKLDREDSFGLTIAVKISTGETAGFKQDMTVYLFDVDISPTPED